MGVSERLPAPRWYSIYYIYMKNRCDNKANIAQLGER